MKYNTNKGNHPVYCLQLHYVARVQYRRKIFDNKIAERLKEINKSVAKHFGIEKVDNYGYIAVEDLQIKNMVKNHNLSKSITDAGWGQFVSFLTYKAEEAGCYVEKVNPRNTSKTSSACGYIYKDMTLAIRNWTCPVCYTIHDRDINASVNILNKTKGQELPEYTLGETGSTTNRSIGYLKSTPPMNQEALPIRAG